MVKYSVERIEANVALLENNGIVFEVDALTLDNGIKEGDIVIENGEGIYIKDSDATESLKKELNMLQNSLFEN